MKNKRFKEIALREWLEEAYPDLIFPTRDIKRLFDKFDRINKKNN